MKQKQSFMRARALIKALGQPSLTPTHAKKLDTLGLTFDDLFTLYLQSGTREAFLAASGPYLGGAGGGATPPPDVFNLLQIQRQIYKITGYLNLDPTSRVTYVQWRIQ